MTTYGAYDAGLPCKNKACKSHGKPHPNCKCYQGMADGGDVVHYCESEKPHRRGCKYFATGGAVNEMDIPKHESPSHSASLYLANRGANGLLDLHFDSPEEAVDKYNSHVAKGNKHLNSKIDSLFGGNELDDEDTSKDQKKIHDWVSSGGITADIQKELDKAPLAMAKGGHVKEHMPLHPEALAEVYPEHNMLLQEAKGRVSQYLNQIKPQSEHAPRLAFDLPPDTREQKKKYDHALQIAVKPARILDEIRKGTITPDKLDHFRNMYPELNETMQKGLTKKIIAAQLKGERPSHRVRQGLSLFMSTPLSGELSPAHMQAAQAALQGVRGQKPSQGSGTSPAKTKGLEKADDSYLTANQAAASRQQKQ